jgi:cytochrome c553
MAPFAAPKVIGGPKGIADVAAYIASLPMPARSARGPGKNLGLGKATYGKMCARCHGQRGEGSRVTFVPRLHGQHFAYLVRQFRWIREGRRRNANPEMVRQIQALSEDQIGAVMDYVSRLEPPPERTAPTGWRNPDFTD